MSGGSFNYLCEKDNDELYEFSVLDEMKRMSLKLAELGHGDAANHTALLIMLIDNNLKHTQEIKKSLEDVWKAVEWYQSYDYGIEKVDEAMEEYRNKNALKRNQK